MDIYNDVDVELIQSVGGDATLAAAAKVLLNRDEIRELEKVESREGVKGLINYLIKHKHGTPFEHALMTFYVDAPIFVWREWHRHRIGFCLGKYSEIWQESVSNSGRTVRKILLEDLYNNWTYGVKDNEGRIRFLPSIYQQKLRTLNEDSQLFELGSIEQIVESGIKETYRLETNHKKYTGLHVTKDHRILTIDGWAKIEELSGNELIAICGKRSANSDKQIPPRLREGIGIWTSMQRNSLIKGTDNCYECKSRFSREELILDHIIPVIKDLTLALNLTNLAPMCEECHRRKTNSEQILANRNTVAGTKYISLKNKPSKIDEEQTYDIVMRGPNHNFVANGIVVHNSYNEESGRYRELRGYFYLPKFDRPMIPGPDHKSARPQFVTVREGVYNEFADLVMESYKVSYNNYKEILKLGIAKEVARIVLPVGTFSRCWVTCNPRSMMAFLSLRVKDENAKFLSYPQWEIQLAAKKCEEIFKELFPITHAAYIENGRVGP